MIDPTVITNYNRTDAELEEFILFCIAVAGKTAKIIAEQLHNFLLDLDDIGQLSPFEKLRKINSLQLMMALKRAKLGKYHALNEAFQQIINVNLRTCTAEDLEKVHGIGPKTARYFLLHSRKDVEVAPLDTHALKFLRSQGHVVPDHTPTGNKYKLLEQVYINEAKKRGKTIAEFDLAVWNYYSKNGNSNINPA